MVILSIIVVLVGFRIWSILNTKFFNRNFIEENIIEVVWTIGPAVLLIFIALPSLQVLYMLEDNFKINIVLKRVGHQWYWSYEYRDFINLEFDSYIVEGDFRLLEVDNSLVVPVNSYLCIVVTSSDVIHSWAVPSLGLKCDAVPGRLNQIIFLVNHSGLFYGQCSEICGSNHSFIPIKIEAVSLDYFSKWVIESS